tara:strand:- start:800 stop:1276 length:477 start_codon:yes stop_codon:yes gene_type:complete
MSHVPNARLSLVHFLHRSLGLSQQQIAELADVSTRQAADWLAFKCDMRDSSWRSFYEGARSLRPFHVLGQEQPNGLEDQNRTFRLIRPADLLYSPDWRVCVWVDLEVSARYFVVLEDRGELVRHWTDTVPPLAEFEYVEEQVGSASLDLIERLTSYAS